MQPSLAKLTHKAADTLCSVHAKQPAYLFPATILQDAGDDQVSMSAYIQLDKIIFLEKWF